MTHTFSDVKFVIAFVTFEGLCFWPGRPFEGGPVLLLLQLIDAAAQLRRPTMDVVALDGALVAHL